MSMAIENKSDDTLRDLDPKKNNMMTLFINNLKNKIDEQAPQNVHHHFRRMIKMMADSESIQSVHLSDNGFDEDQISDIKKKFHIYNKPASQKLETDKMILLNKLKEIYMSYDVNRNPKLTDHAKIINGQLISQLNQDKLLHIKNRKIEPSLIDIFHDNLIFVRNIGHSELVFSNDFHGSMQKDFSKNWKLDGNTDKSTSYECFICHRYRYVQIYFRRETIQSDFEVVKDP